MLNGRKDKSWRDFDLFNSSLNSKSVHCVRTQHSHSSPPPRREWLYACSEIYCAGSAGREEGMMVGCPSPAPAVVSAGASLLLWFSPPVPLCWLTMDGYWAGLCCVLSHMAESLAPLFGLCHVVLSS